MSFVSNLARKEVYLHIFSLWADGTGRQERSVRSSPLLVVIVVVVGKTRDLLQLHSSRVVESRVLRSAPRRPVLLPFIIVGVALEGWQKHSAF